MTLKGSSVRNTLLGILLLFAGMYGQYRFQILQRYVLSTPVGSVFEVSQLAQVRNTEPPTEDVDFSLFWEVWQTLEREYLEPEKINSRELVHGAIQGMTAAVGDPYTLYLPPDDNERSAQDLAGSFYGVGIELGYIDNTLAVIAPLKGTPAADAGVQAGDLILHVRDEAKDVDEDTTNWSISQAVDYIRGPKGTPITLTLYRQDNGAQPFDVTLNRGEIVVRSVELTFEEHAGKRVAHISLSRFGERTESEWNETVGQILAEGTAIDGIVLDMRNNPGGYFDGAIDVASEFISRGIVVSQKGKYTSQDFQARGRARLEGKPVVVLVNRGSASASEIVAGALRDQLGVQLVGENTFGKGTVQDRRELSNGGGLHVTVSRWMLPSGQWIHDEGIPVSIEAIDDLETEGTDEALLRAIEVL